MISLKNNSYSWFLNNITMMIFYTSITYLNFNFFYNLQEVEDHFLLKCYTISLGSIYLKNLVDLMQIRWKNYNFRFFMVKIDYVCLFYVLKCRCLMQQDL